MKKPRLLGAVCATLLLGLLQSAKATTVTYDVATVSGITWEYTYTVANDSLGIDIDEFTIFFAESLYENLAVSSTPPDWDPLVIQPDPGLPDDGFYDALALSAGIAASATLGGFSVQFDYLGTGTPDDQIFTVIDPNTFATLDSGMTQLAAVPIPAAVWLFGSGLLSLFMTGIGGKRNRQTALDGFSRS